MALIKCPECGKEISDKASSCPNCGCPIGTAVIRTPATPTNIPMKPVPKKKHGCLITILVFLFFVFIMGTLINLGSSSSDDTSHSGTSTNQEAESSTLTKEDAQKIDSVIWDYVYPVIIANNNLMSAMSGYSDGTVSELDFYNATKNFKDYAQTTWGNSPSVEDKNAKKYLESCRDYILVEQTMADSLLKYLDTKKTGDLSKVQENIERCTQAVQIVASNRGVFLGINNFNDEEIQKITEDSMQ